jgi:hypothetical protein
MRPILIADVRASLEAAPSPANAKFGAGTDRKSGVTTRRAASPPADTTRASVRPRPRRQIDALPLQRPRYAVACGLFEQRQRRRRLDRARPTFAASAPQLRRIAIARAARDC